MPFSEWQMLLPLFTSGSVSVVGIKRSKGHSANQSSLSEGLGYIWVKMIKVMSGNFGIGAFEYGRYFLCSILQPVEVNHHAR